MTSILTTLAKDLSASDMQRLSYESNKWLKSKVSGLRNFNNIRKDISKEEFRYSKRFMLGRLYFFFYDPKTKDDLPYYDKFPLTIVLDRYDDGFLGLNLHYLPIKYRIQFLGKLMNYASTNHDNEIIRVRITYDILQASRKIREFRPCLKRYLFSNIKSKILTVQPNEWEVASFLPVHLYKNAAPTKVWEDSLKEFQHTR